jgi:hypothetical protein
VFVHVEAFQLLLAGDPHAAPAPATTLAPDGKAAAPAAGDTEPTAKAPQTGRTAFLNRRSPIFTRRCIASSRSPLATQAGFRVLAARGPRLVTTTRALVARSLIAFSRRGPLFDSKRCLSTFYPFYCRHRVF